ncbi:MAG TPA: Dabb family protein [Marmoricola sp.]|jgi:hypothetical protein|nr:Dabb family protein [Marmoricola sp.]
MIQHVVAFRFQGASLDQRRRNAERAAELLRPLAGSVPGLRELVIENDRGADPAHWDMVLISHHDSLDALLVYMDHPLHSTAKSAIDQIVEQRAIVDFEILDPSGQTKGTNHVR